MNYIKHLTGFFEKVAQDKSLNPTHVSLYIALFQFWNCNRFKNPFSISRDEVMRISKISSKATYHKCMKNLNESGYVDYQPSYNPFKGSLVSLFNFSDVLKPNNKSDRSTKNDPLIYTSAEQALNRQCTSSETSTEQAVVPSINNINILNKINNSNIKNSLNKSKQAEPNEIKKADFLEAEIKTEKEKKWREKKKDEIDDTEMTGNNSIPKNHFILPGLGTSENLPYATPQMEEVQHFFSQHNFPEVEAQKFHNYFSSIGWLVGGRTPMQNWNAAAQNWMLNANKFSKESHAPTPNASKLNATTDKNYAEPL